MLSREVRKMVVEARERGVTVARIAEVAGVNERAIYKLLKQVRETGSYAPRLSTRGRKATIDAEGMKLWDQYIQEHPDATLEEMKEALNIPLGHSQMDRIVRLKMGYTYKKNSSCEREGTTRHRRKANEVAGGNAVD